MSLSPHPVACFWPFQGANVGVILTLCQLEQVFRVIYHIQMLFIYNVSFSGSITLVGEERALSSTVCL